MDINEFLAAMLDWDELEKTLNQDGNGFNDLLFEVFSEFDKDCTGRLNLVSNCWETLFTGLNFEYTYATLDLALRIPTTICGG